MLAKLGIKYEGVLTCSPCWEEPCLQRLEGSCPFRPGHVFLFREEVSDVGRTGGRIGSVLSWVANHLQQLILVGAILVLHASLCLAGFGASSAPSVKHTEIWHLLLSSCCSFCPDKADRNACPTVEVSLRVQSVLSTGSISVHPGSRWSGRQHPTTAELLCFPVFCCVWPLLEGEGNKKQGLFFLNWNKYSHFGADQNQCPNFWLRAQQANTGKCYREPAVLPPTLQECTHIGMQRGSGH